MAHLASANNIQEYAELKEAEKSETARLAEKAGKLKEFLRAQEEAEAAEAAEEADRQRRREERARKREARKRESGDSPVAHSRSPSGDGTTGPSSVASDSAPPSPRSPSPDPVVVAPRADSPDGLSVQDREELELMAAAVKARRSQSDRDRLGALGEMMLLSDMSATSLATSSGLSSSARAASEVSEPVALRVAVLGVPALTRRRVLPGIFGATHCSIVAVADPTAADEAAREAESFRIGAFAGSAVADLVDSKENNAVAVTSDSLVTADVVRRALAAGKPVLLGPFASCSTVAQADALAEAEATALATAAASSAPLRPVVRCLPLREESLTLRATVTRVLKDKLGDLLYVEGCLADGHFFAGEPAVPHDPTVPLVTLLELVRSYTGLTPATLSAAAHHGGRLALATGSLHGEGLQSPVPLSLRVSHGLVGHMAADTVTLAGTAATVVVDLATGEVRVGEVSDRTLYPTFLRHDAWRVEEAWTDAARGDDVADEAVAWPLSEARANLVARAAVQAALANDGASAAGCVVTVAAPAAPTSGGAAEATIKKLVDEKAALQRALDEARAAATVAASSASSADTRRADDLATRERTFSETVARATAQLETHATAVESLRRTLATL